MKNYICVFISLLLLLLLTSCATKKMIDADFNKVEAVVLNDFSIDKNDLLLNSKTRARASKEYDKILDMMVYSAQLYEYVPTERLIFSIDHRYNIFATGKEIISFKILRVTNNETELEVNYFENTNLAGCLPVTFDSGSREEKEIIEEIIKKIK